MEQKYQNQNGMNKLDNLNILYTVAIIYNLDFSPLKIRLKMTYIVKTAGLTEPKGKISKIR